MYYISVEWARQLALDALGEKDVKEVNFTPDLRSRWLVARFHSSNFSLAAMQKIEEPVDMRLWADPLNGEITPIGYGPITGVLVVGPTRKF